MKSWGCKDCSVAVGVSLSVSLRVTERVCAVLLQQGSRDWAAGWCKGQWASELCVAIQRTIDTSHRKGRPSASMQLKMPEPGWFKCLLSPAGSPLGLVYQFSMSERCVSVHLVPSGELHKLGMVKLKFQKPGEMVRG